MLMTFEQTAKLIQDGKLLHIAGAESLLRKLPQGKWIGGSTEYFMDKDGGKISGELLFVTQFPSARFAVKTYSVQDISRVAEDAFENGFSIVIVPADSAVHKEYAQKAAEFDKMFLRNIAGWVSGVNLGIPGQAPLTVNGEAAQSFTDKAVALHLEAPADKQVIINIVNIFEADPNSPLIEFTEEGFFVTKCLINGAETVFADYIAQNSINIKHPLVGDYSGSGINVSFRSVENGVVTLYAPVFRGIRYRMAKDVLDYEKVFNSHVAKLQDANVVFSCNCILNFLYGELEGKRIDALPGPITFGEIAYGLVNQTLVYVTIS